MTDSTPVVSVRGASRRFGETEVLSGLDLEVRAGEVVAVVGPNGGGKSTLLLMMAGLVKPTAGEVVVCGVTAHRLALESAGMVGLVMARPGLYPLLTGRENLEYFGGLFGLSPPEVAARSDELVAALDLADSMEARLSTWSTGMQQKLSLIRALLLSPRLLLFDEPTANLDPLAAETLYGELRRRADEGLACVLVTHDLSAAESICDRAWLLDGTVREEVVLDGGDHVPSGPLLEAWKRSVAS